MKKKLMFLMILGVIFQFTKVDASNIVKAYQYDQTNSNTLCITGEEQTCVETKCYQDKTTKGCKSGDIIQYKVNNQEIVTFHVVFDEGNTLVMQQQKNTVGGSWITKEDFLTAGGVETDYSDSLGLGNNMRAPLTILKSLEDKTKGWSNVKTQSYEMGTTTFKTNQYTGCAGGAHNESMEITCTTNLYTLPTRSARARMITAQEAALLGCTGNHKTCPKWMYNYLQKSTSYEGTANDASVGGGYYTMQVRSGSVYAYAIYEVGSLSFGSANGARAVVVVDKEDSNEINNSNNTSIKEENKQKNNSQTVNVGNTLKTVYIGYIIGSSILVLGIMILIQTYRKGKKKHIS